MTPATVPRQPDTAGILYQYRERIYRYISTIVRDSAEADDLTQVALLRAYHNYASLRDPASLTSWLYRIATHVAVDHLRQRARRAPLQADVDLEAVDVPEEETPSLLKWTEQGEMSTCVQRYLDSLRDPYRAVIMLHDLHGMTGPDIAVAMGVSLPNVKIRLHRARLKLRAALEAGCDFSCDERGVLVCEARSAPAPLELTLPPTGQDQPAESQGVSLGSVLSSRQ
jgi:RNA polymerase sigma-70 factor, ECF subfamily